MEQPELVGRWRADVQGQPGPIVLQLAPHPEWEGTVKGRIERPDGTSIVVGDVHRGAVTLEESRDGRRVSGHWDGQVQEGSCARILTGEWSGEDDQPHAFTLTRLP